MWGSDWILKQEELGWYMETKRLKPPAIEVVDTHNNCKLFCGNPFQSRTLRGKELRCSSCSSGTWCHGAELNAFLRVSLEAQTHVLPSCLAFCFSSSS